MLSVWSITATVLLKSLWWILPLVAGIPALAVMEHYEEEAQYEAVQERY